MTGAELVPLANRESGPQAPSVWVRVAALAAATAFILYLCALILAPFLPGVTWAVALAVVGMPLHHRIGRLVGNTNWTAGVSTALVTLLILIPILLVSLQLAAEARQVGSRIQGQATDGRLLAQLEQIPLVRDWIGMVGDQISVEDAARTLVSRLWAVSAAAVPTALGATLQILVAVFVLFFAFRDHDRLLAELRNYVPLDRADTERVIDRAAGAVNATVYGTIVCGVVQGVTGGLLFWVLGLPGPVLWGVVMAVLGVLPFVGAFVVWVPAAAYLAGEDRFGAAAVLVGWGLFMAGPVSNYLYAVSAAGRMRMHPVPALLAFIGGLAAFGISGMVLGPVILAVAAAVLDAWRLHVMRGRPLN